MIYETHSAEETRALARRMAAGAHGGMVYSLTGDLGAGKTVFTQGFAGGLGVTEPVTSPTFTIIQEYDTGRLPFYHFDVYRIADPEELEMIGYDEYISGDGVCLIEWANLIEEILPAERVDIRMESDPLKGPDFRRIEVKELHG